MVYCGAEYDPIFLSSRILAGVAVCTVTDVSVNLDGFLAARRNLRNGNILLVLSIYSAQVQAASLLSVGVFFDSKDAHYRSIAVGTSLSQFICIGRFTAVSFRVIGHMKTILVLVLGFTFFGKEGLNMQVVLAILGTERRSLLTIPINQVTETQRVI
ncbi:hypothetical protein Bca52824_012286 [Brassica carinata]|uniref:Uncharacterized protein n=1 Tax=Brassica carinata TaxID=52824 RepID=A0A8X8B284_BRACI|nr:hypothetical protein Bca52824_012286 [Brassica carinata]